MVLLKGGEDGSEHHKLAHTSTADESSATCSQELRQATLQAIVKLSKYDIHWLRTSEAIPVGMLQDYDI